VGATSFQKIQRWIEDKWRHADCPVCASNGWQVGGNLAELRNFNDGDMVVGGPVYPILPIFCSNCGYALLINAVIADLLADPVAPPPSEVPEEASTPPPPVER
jgi:hypothetical protein